MKLLFINGASCAGKTTILKEIMKQQPYLFHLSFDSLKWMFSNYDRSTHKEDVSKLFFNTEKTVLELGYDILCESGVWKEYREKTLNLAKEYGYTTIEINLEADQAVLEERFEERLRNRAINKIKMATTSIDRFRELWSIYQAEKNKDAKTYYTDKTSPEEIAADVLKELRK